MLSDEGYSHRGLSLGAYDQQKDMKKTKENLGACDKRKEATMAYDVLSDEGYSHRGLSIIDKDGVVRDQMVTDEPLGRSVEEAVRILDAMQYFEKSEEVCQVNFKGEESLEPAGTPLRERLAK